MDRSWHLFVKISLTLLVAVGLGLVYLNANLSRQFESHSWAVGAKIYARTLELFLDAPFTVDQVSFELDLLNYQGVAERPGRGQYQNDGQSLWVGLRGHGFRRSRRVGGKLFENGRQEEEGEGDRFGDVGELRGEREGDGGGIREEDFDEYEY